MHTPHVHRHILHLHVHTHAQTYTDMFTDICRYHTNVHRHMYKFMYIYHRHKYRTQAHNTYVQIYTPYAFTNMFKTHATYMYTDIHNTNVHRHTRKHRHVHTLL